MLELQGRVASSLRQRGVQTARDRWVLDEVTSGEQSIGPPSIPVIPAHFAKTCSSAALGRLRAFLEELCRWADGLVGLGDLEATVLYNGDPMAILLRDELIDWTLDYTADRLRRPSPKDQGDPYLKWNRLITEVCGWLDSFCLTPGHGAALATVPDRIAWEIWRDTVGRELSIARVGEELRLDLGRLDPRWTAAIRETVLLYAWQEADALERAHARLTDRASGEPSDLRSRCARMAADIAEARPLLVGTHDPLAMAVEVGGGWTSFEWYYQHAIGTIVCGPSRASLAAQVGSGHLHGPLLLDFSGRIAGMVRWWDPAQDPAWEVALLEPIHARLVEAWLHRAPAVPPEDEPQNTMAAVAAVADVCTRIAEPVEGRQIPALRTEALLRLLERSFGCEIGAGKGSEITVYRRGGRIFTLGHHRRNVHVPAHVVRALLKAVGITVREWWQRVT